MYDFIIIGSGTSGGVLAYNLTQAGANCLLLEAGSLYRADTFPKTELDYSARLFWGGGLEFDAKGKLAFLRAKCVGGTSIVNQCLLDRFDEVAFSDWKAQSEIDFFTPTMMEAYYEKIENALSLQTIAEKHFNRNTELFIKGFEAKNYGWAPLRRGQSDCGLDEGNDCIGCLGGCHRDSKQSTLVAFLEKAFLLGLELKSQFLVEKLESHSDFVEVFGSSLKEKLSFQGRAVILAGGALGTNKILLNSGFKKELPSLGKGFSCHPQYMSFGVFSEPIDSHKGAFQAVKSQDSGFRRAGFKLENVFGPPISVAFLFSKGGIPLLQFMKKYRYLSSIEVAIRDEAVGEFKIDKKGRFRIEKELTVQDLKRGKEGLQVVAELMANVGAEAVFQSPFNFGLHLMGGCAIGNSPQNSVVNEKFQVHGKPNLFIADSSIFPNAPGINPALTIMALSQKLSEGLVANQSEALKE